MYINLLYLPLFKFAFILSFLSFLSSQHICQFYFHCFLPTWYVALVLFSSFCFSQFCPGRHNFWFPLFTRSMYCTLFLLDCFDFAYGCICICHIYIQLNYFIFVINFCLYVQFCSSVEFSFFIFFFPFFLCFIILIFLTYYDFFFEFVPLFDFPTFFPPCS